MKTIKVFIASSNELKLERLHFSNLMLSLNRILKLRDLELEAVKWEYLDASMGLLHKQEEYNRELKSCKLCVVLFWTKFGEYTKCEFDTAYSEFCAGRNPQRLYVYFKDAEDITPELKAFQDSFVISYGTPFCRFKNIDTMKLHFLIQLEELLKDDYGPILGVRDSLVTVFGKPFLELANIHFDYISTEYLQHLNLHDVSLFGTSGDK